MGTGPRSCKGFFLASSRCKLIVINSDLPENIQRIIIAHELGHAVLHGDSAISAFHEFAIFDATDRMEYEANVFAAEFMLDDDEVMESLEMQMDFFQMAKCLYVAPELLDFKLRILQQQGVKINAPYIAHGDFLKRDLGQPYELSMLPGAAFKVYVNVLVEHTAEGLMLPRTIVWEDGLKYDIGPSD